jgi:alkylation response protein AidB-like acyl-CoA dehydrogenase
MDLELDDDQQAVRDAVEALLAKHVDLDATGALVIEGSYDAALRNALEESGFLGIALEEGASWLDAALLVEHVARRGGLVDAGAAAIVAPAVCGRTVPGPIALLERGHRGPARFGAHARSALVESDGDVRLVALEPSGKSIESNFGWPLGPVAVPASGGESLGAEAVDVLRRFWRLAIAAECVGAMQGAFDTTVEYVKQRRQFGRAIGSFQAIQHRLAELAVLIEGGRWLVYEAAHFGADAPRAAAAAAHATATAERVFAETHQLTGAMGYTREHVLHLWTMRLPVLRLELGGARAHRIAAAQARWGSAARA